MESNFIQKGKDGTTLRLSMDVFYMYVAGHINAIPTLRAFFDELYETNKIEFFEKAKNSPFCDATYITDSPLDREVSMRRAFGVLLHSEQDEQLQDKICKAIIKHNKAYATFTKSYSLEQLVSFLTSSEKSARGTNKTPDEINATIYLLAYIIYCKHGLAKKDKQSVKFLHDYLVKDIAKRESYDQGSFLKFVDGFNVSKHYIENRQLKEYISAAKNDNALCALLDCLSCLQDSRIESTITATKLTNIFAKCSDEEADSSIFTSLLASRIFSLYGKSITMSAKDTHFSNEELERIYRITAMSALTRNSDTSGMVRVSDFTQALWFAMLVKTIKQERDFYFKNNSETQFFALRNLEREVEQLREQLGDQEAATSEAKAHAATLSDQISLLNTELAKETKDAAKPLLGEISILKNQIAALESKLQEETAKNAELARLREFVFDMQQGNDIQLEEIPLDSYIVGKKIYIFGGHINWRNRLKQKYPKLEVLDGHNVSFDEQKLLGADMVLMNTSNMSHALYYKIIDVLRKNNIPFDYLGKYSNPNLLEQEIAEALLRKR